MKAERVKEGGAMAEVSDEDLMIAIAAGDKRAFQTLAQRYTNMFYSVAYRMVSQKADAEDIVQETLLRIWSKAHLWKAGSGAAVSTWLYRLAYNLCIDMKRKDKMSTISLDDQQIDSGQTADKKLQDKQTGALVGKAVKGLPERQRAALVLCHYQGLSNAEAADIMGTSVKAIEGLLVRGRQALRQDLSQYQGVL